MFVSAQFQKRAKLSGERVRYLRADCVGLLLGLVVADDLRVRVLDGGSALSREYAHQKADF